MRRHDVLRDPAREIEHRPDRPYDEKSAGIVVHPNGSLVASMDRGVQASTCRAVLELLGVTP